MNFLLCCCSHRLLPLTVYLTITSQQRNQIQITRKPTECVYFLFQSALQNSPWGLMQALEQQVGELRINTDDGCYDGAQGDTGDSRPSSGNSLVLNLFFDLSSDMHEVKSFINVHNSLTFNKASQLTFCKKYLLYTTKLMFSLCILKYGCDEFVLIVRSCSTCL